MNRKARLFVLFVFIGAVGVALLFASFDMGSSPSANIGGCSRFGAPLSWQEIGLEKFQAFWATKNGIDQKYCEANGGTWGAWSKAWQSCYCAMAAPDALKPCRNSSECLSGTCLYDAKLAKGVTVNTIGSCAEFKMQYPTPNCEFDRVENGNLVKKNCVK
jgi:hypothetical protein